MFMQKTHHDAHLGQVYGSPALWSLNMDPEQWVDEMSTRWYRRLIEGRLAHPICIVFSFLIICGILLQWRASPAV
jgi:hypothetical protein